MQGINFEPGEPIMSLWYLCGDVKQTDKQNSSEVQGRSCTRHIELGVITMQVADKLQE